MLAPPQICGPSTPASKHNSKGINNVSVEAGHPGESQIALQEAQQHSRQAKAVDIESAQAEASTAPQQLHEHQAQEQQPGRQLPQQQQPEQQLPGQQQPEQQLSEQQLPGQQQPEQKLQEQQLPEQQLLSQDQQQQVLQEPKQQQPRQHLQEPQHQHEQHKQQLQQLPQQVSFSKQIDLPAKQMDLPAQRLAMETKRLEAQLGIKDQEHQDIQEELMERLATAQHDAAANLDLAIQRQEELMELGDALQKLEQQALRSQEEHQQELDRKDEELVRKGQDHARALAAKQEEHKLELARKDEAHQQELVRNDQDLGLHKGQELIAMAQASSRTLQEEQTKDREMWKSLLASLQLHVDSAAKAEHKKTILNIKSQKLKALRSQLAEKKTKLERYSQRLSWKLRHNKQTREEVSDWSEQRLTDVLADF